MGQAPVSDYPSDRRYNSTIATGNWRFSHRSA